MKTATLQNRISKLKLNKNSAIYKMLIELMEGKKFIRPCYTVGMFTTTACDNTAQMKNVLDTLRIKYIFGNDAPRGGKCGNYYKIITKITR